MNSQTVLNSKQKRGDLVKYIKYNNCLLISIQASLSYR